MTEKKTKKNKAPVVVVKKKVCSLEQYLQRKGVKQHHKGGMRAYIDNPNKRYTMEEWDKLFEGY